MVAWKWVSWRGVEVCELNFTGGRSGRSQTCLRNVFCVLTQAHHIYLTCHNGSVQMISSSCFGAKPEHPPFFTLGSIHFLTEYIAKVKYQNDSSDDAGIQALVLLSWYTVHSAFPFSLFSFSFFFKMYKLIVHCT